MGRRSTGAGCRPQRRPARSISRTLLPQGSWPRETAGSEPSLGCCVAINQQGSMTSWPAPMNRARLAIGLIS